jgi:hypothetical protein
VPRRSHWRRCNRAVPICLSGESRLRDVTSQVHAALHALVHTCRLEQERPRKNARLMSPSYLGRASSASSLLPSQLRPPLSLQLHRSLSYYPPAPQKALAASCRPPRSLRLSLCLRSTRRPRFWLVCFSALSSSCSQLSASAASQALIRQTSCTPSHFRLGRSISQCWRLLVESRCVLAATGPYHFGQHQPSLDCSVKSGFGFELQPFQKKCARSLSLPPFVACLRVTRLKTRRCCLVTRFYRSKIAILAILQYPARGPGSSRSL